MPELPEVDEAARRAREVLVGREIRRVVVLHPSQRRSLPLRACRQLVGQEVEGIARRGKYQLIALTSGSTLLVHFRLNGDWVHAQTGEELPAHARIVLEMVGGDSLVLTDSRALCTMTLHAPGEVLLADLGPDAIEPAFNAEWLAAQVEKRRIAIKVVLLDQRVVAGVGNIYASEALWEARVSPHAVASSLRRARLERIVSGIRSVMGRAMQGAQRYYGSDATVPAEVGVDEPQRFNVYDREGDACMRCGSAIRREVQAGRSTYWCGKCQR